MWKLNPKMQEYVQRTGLHHLAELKKGKIDHALINVLIERWRPETNTFHFVGGEATITLEDMSYLYGLPVDGKALSTNNAGAHGHAYLLQLFENFERYVWGPACLACIYRSMTRATLKKDRLRTITRPLQLLQIWAYSRTAVGHPMRKELEAVRIEFPLFKMWQTVLSTHPCSTPMQEVQRLLDTNKFEWQPYRQWSLQLEQVYKQFGLRQPVPPPFHRWERLNEKASKDSVDYTEICKKFVDAWDVRGDMAMIAEANDGGQCHDENYLSWYHQASVKSCNPLKAVPRYRVEKALTKVDLFLQFGAGSIALMAREQGAEILYEQSMRLGQKMQEFRQAIKSLEGLEEFDLQALTNEDISSGSANVSGIEFSSISERSIEEVLQTAFSTVTRKKERADSTVRQRTQTNRTASQSLQSMVPFKRKAGEDSDTKVCRDRSNDDTVPALLSPYPPATYRGAAQPNQEYHLDPVERSLLEKFWREYHSAYDCFNLYMSSNEM
ncbi:serine/threonine-protein phosphatase 7 long form [Cinnamomum micranthum f. kanehirae]|uniref:Serine/threonine-protein phosphatase 7 long form n=1 Tax=Cinnamomum micranthum f. kanehirae TaxID=337451 RepID=A0A443NYB1_9MAGN|nr:serine/threonine-protein phosphatase 7 long form [Cinnamomum micranthum f. kanehirae]